MSEREKITRKGFLKLGGAGSLCLVINHQSRQLGNYDLLESKEAFGGFTIRMSRVMLNDSSIP